jgi:prophage antirepressor-like protein
MTTPHTNGSRRNGHDHSHAQPAHSPGKGTQREEKQSLDAALAHQFDFDGAQVRVISIDGAPWFVAADVCRALNLLADKGTFAHHLEKLDEDEKQRINRASIPPTTLRSNGGVGEHPETKVGLHDDGPAIWVISESGLYLLMMRSRDATKLGTVPYRFRRWVTRDVLPTIRMTGSYGQTSITGETVTFSLAKPARYVVMVSPGELPHIRKTPKDKLLDEWSGLDTEILANHMRTVDALWQKTQLVRSVGDDPAGSLLYKRLGKAISDGRRIADECLDSFRQQPD